MSRRLKKSRTAENYVVIGGGIAGVGCAQELARLASDKNIILISASDTLVESKSIFKISTHLDEVAVYEKKTDQFQFDNPNIEIIAGQVAGIDISNQSVQLQDGTSLPYTKLCICSGVRPKLLGSHRNIIGLRDLESVEQLSARLATARKVAVVGNGGIALELVHELTSCDVAWVVRDAYLGSAFFDASAAHFILPALQRRIQANESVGIIAKQSASAGADEAEMSHDKITTTGGDEQSASTAAANGRYSGYGLGPEWIAKSGFVGGHKSAYASPSFGAGDTVATSSAGDGADNEGKLTIHYNQQVVAVSEDRCSTWQAVDGGGESDIAAALQCVGCSVDVVSEADCYPLHILTNTGEVIGCDFVVSATGVLPNTAFVSAHHQSTTDAPIALTEEGYIIVGERLESSVPGVFAAGDCCSFEPSEDSGLQSEHYFQMRLWTQARSMGMYVAQCMLGREAEYGLDGQFDLFAHVTRFFGYKVVMLGRYNAQGLGAAVEAVTKEIVLSKDGMEGRTRGGGATWTTTESCSSGSSNSISRSSSSSSVSSDTRRIEFLLRVTPGVEYIKLCLCGGRVVGALLIGNDCDGLEEVCENLILNRLDVGALGIGLLNPDIDIADYFD